MNQRYGYFIFIIFKRGINHAFFEERYDTHVGDIFHKLSKTSENLSRKLISREQMCETSEKMDLLAATEWKSGGNLASDPRIRCQSGNRMKHEDRRERANKNL